jgi:superfamily I DNA and/or RNA helicase
MGFLKHENRINVALTRAKHGLVIVGSRKNLSIDPNWASFLNSLEKDGVIVNGLQEAI